MHNFILPQAHKITILILAAMTKHTDKSDGYSCWEHMGRPSSSDCMQNRRTVGLKTFPYKATYHRGQLRSSTSRPRADFVAVHLHSATVPAIFPRTESTTIPLPSFRPGIIQKECDIISMECDEPLLCHHCDAGWPSCQFIIHNHKDDDIWRSWRKW